MRFEQAAPIDLVFLDYLMMKVEKTRGQRSRGSPGGAGLVVSGTELLQEASDFTTSKQLITALLDATPDDRVCCLYLLHAPPVDAWARIVAKGYARIILGSRLEKEQQMLLTKLDVNQDLTLCYSAVVPHHVQESLISGLYLEKRAATLVLAQIASLDHAAFVNTRDLPFSVINDLLTLCTESGLVFIFESDQELLAPLWSYCQIDGDAYCYGVGRFSLRTLRDKQILPLLAEVEPPSVRSSVLCLQILHQDVDLPYISSDVLYRYWTQSNLDQTLDRVEVIGNCIKIELHS